MIKFFKKDHTTLQWKFAREILAKLPQFSFVFIHKKLLFVLREKSLKCKSPHPPPVKFRSKCAFKSHLSVHRFDAVHWKPSDVTWNRNSNRKKYSIFISHFDVIEFSLFKSRFRYRMTQTTQQPRLLLTCRLSQLFPSSSSCYRL